MSETKNINVTVNDLKDKNYDFFEQIILSLIAKYKNNPNLKNWYAAIGDNCNGSLKENFNKEVFDYTYTGSEIEAVPEDDKSTVNIINRKDKSIIIVKSQSGDIGVYTLTKYKSNFINIIIYILLSLTTILSATGCYLMKNKLKKINPDLKNKNKKNKVNIDNK